MTSYELADQADTLAIAGQWKEALALYEQASDELPMENRLEQDSFADYWQGKADLLRMLLGIKQEFQPTLMATLLAGTDPVIIC